MPGYNLLMDDDNLAARVSGMHRRLDAIGVPAAPESTESPSDTRGHYAQAKQDAPARWPKGVRSISIEGLELLGVGDDGRLYWDGVPVEVARTFTLSWWQRLGAVLVSLSAVVAAISAALSAYADLAKP